MTDKIRIWTVTYCGSGNVVRPRVATVVVKVPYGGAYAMTELLTRMVAIGQIRWYAVWASKPDEIARTKDWPGLERWLPALTKTSTRTGVDWTA